MDTTKIPEIDLTKLIKGIQKNDARIVKDELILLCGTMSKYRLINKYQKESKHKRLNNIHTIDVLTEVAKDFLDFCAYKELNVTISEDLYPLVKPIDNTKETEDEINITDKNIDPYNRLTDYEKGVWDMFQEATIIKKGQKGYSLNYNEDLGKVTILNFFNNTIINFDDINEEFKNVIS